MGKKSVFLADTGERNVFFQIIGHKLSVDSRNTKAVLTLALKKATGNLTNQWW